MHNLNSSICIFYAAIFRAICMRSWVSIGQWSEKAWKHFLAFVRSIIMSECRYKLNNEHNMIINCTMVYRAAFWYTNEHRKGYGKRFFSIIPQIYVAGKARTIFCKREAFESSSVFWSLYKGPDLTRPCPTRAVWIDWDMIFLKPDVVSDVPLRIIRENEDIVLPPRPRGAFMKRQKADVSNNFYFS